MRRWLAATVALGLVACGYPEFGFVTPVDSALDLDTSIAPDTSTNADADARAADGALDADTRDTADAADAAIDSTTTADGSDASDTIGPDSADVAPLGCTVAHVFCASFDGVATPSAGWTGTFSAAGGTLALDGTTSVSAPNSLRATVPSSSVTASAMVNETITIATGATVIRIDADVMLPATSYGGANNVIMLKVQRSSAGDGFALTAGATGVELVAQTDSSWKAWPLTGIVAGKWFHLRMDVMLHPTSGTVRAWVDDMTTAQVDETGVASANVDDLSRQLIVGLFSFTSAVPFVARFDDVSIDLP